MDDDLSFMRRALQLAQTALGRTSPNPLVGAVIVRDGEIVGEGFHAKAGEAHAEVVALRQAGTRARGATAYVTLEPCAHFGRTPPCANALIQAGIRRVVYAIGDPNPKVNGKGAAILREAGIVVEEGVCSEEARAINRPFFHAMQTNLPYVTAKFGMSLDGKIATKTGESQWITNARSREEGHRLRNVSDVLLVGVGTVLADDPRLTTRLPATTDVRHPVRLILDTHLRTPLTAQLCQPTLEGRTIIATTESADPHKIAQLQQQGVTVWRMPLDGDGRVDLPAVLQEVVQHGWQTAMVEGGGGLLGSLLKARAIQQVWAFIAPILIGGDAAPTPFGGHGFAALAEALRLRVEGVQLLDGDVWVKAISEKSKTV